MSAPGVRPRLVVVWALLATLVGAIVVIEHTDLVRPGLRASTADPRLLLPVPVEQLGAIEVADGGTLHRFERDATGAWFYHGVHATTERPHTHTVEPSTARRIEEALLAFGRTRVERQLPRDQESTAYGLTTPRMLILVYRPNESHPLVQYAVGDIAPDAVSRYVEAVGGPGVVTVPNYQIDNLVTLIAAVRGAPASR
jgi:hypothetical protein